MSGTTRRDPILRRILRDTVDASTTVHDTTLDFSAPVDAGAAATLRERLMTVAQMHHDGQMSDAQLLAVVPALGRAAVATSAIRHLHSPEQRELARQRAIDSIAGALTDEDAAKLHAAG